ncbi:MAG TPA: TonB-dependent receptor [Thermoanaerobaculia bacterium]|nr:TonB-dependent receptor [Thermoanaerobaculia bacterium]
MAPARDIRRSPAPPHRRRRWFLGVLLLLPLIAAAESPETEAESASPAEPPAAVLDDEIVVTATGSEGLLAETASAVTVLGAEELAAAAAVTLDDTLRQVPGFTLFRRSGSRSANPTIQGASLRGAGGSGAGRAMVLADGVPLADPFGGWIAWGRVPRVALARVEVLRGGASDLYGSAALAGVVQLVRRAPSPGGVVAETFAGGQGTAAASLWAARGAERWATSFAGEVFETTGHVPVTAEARGAVDAPAGARHSSLEATVERRAPRPGGPQLLLRGGRFDEDRTNGTRLQENATTIDHASLEAGRFLAGGTLSARAWVADHRFAQTFTAVADDRSSERLVRRQRVPADELGARLGWQRPLGGRHTLIAGFEAARRRGVSHETVFLESGELATAAGGRQEVSALSVEDLVRLGDDLSLVAGLRYDTWRNRPAGDDGGTRSRSDDHLSPRLSLRWQPRPAWGFTLGGFRSFRAPTLNELYRGFRVGDVVTEPNDALAPERASGLEVGAIWQPATSGREGRVRLRGTLFAMRIDDPVANLTLAIEPGLIRRQRRNLGRTRSRGVELEAAARLGRHWHLGASYLATDAEVVRFPGDPTLEGLRVPQVPEHQGSLSLRGAFGGDRRGSVGVQVRAAGEQADDDRNLLWLDGYVLLDGRLGWALGRGFEAWVAGENLLDEEVVVGRTPEVTIGSPRLVRLGLRWRAGRSLPAAARVSSPHGAHRGSPTGRRPRRAGSLRRRRPAGRGAGGVAGPARPAADADRGAAPEAPGGAGVQRCLAAAAGRSRRRRRPPAAAAAALSRQPLPQALAAAPRPVGPLRALPPAPPRCPPSRRGGTGGPRLGAHRRRRPRPPQRPGGSPGAVVGLIRRFPSGRPPYRPSLRSTATAAPPRPGAGRRARVP